MLILYNLGAATCSDICHQRNKTSNQVSIATIMRASTLETCALVVSLAKLKAATTIIALALIFSRASELAATARLQL